MDDVLFPGGFGKSGLCWARDSSCLRGEERAQGDGLDQAGVWAGQRAGKSGPLLAAALPSQASPPSGSPVGRAHAGLEAAGLHESASWGGGWPHCWPPLFSVSGH